jgi:hypothetical protein
MDADENVNVADEPKNRELVEELMEQSVAGWGAVEG